jgi:hypothetical protein
MVPVRAVKRNVLAGSQVGVTVVLVAGRAESGSAKCAFGHYLLPPRRLAISIGNTGHPVKIPLASVANPISGMFQARARFAPSVRALNGHPGVPLAAFGEDVAQQHDVVGHHAVGAKVQGALDLRARVQRPHVHVQPELV